MASSTLAHTPENSPPSSLVLSGGASPDSGLGAGLGEAVYHARRVETPLHMQPYEISGVASPEKPLHSPYERSLEVRPAPQDVPSVPATHHWP